MSAAAKKLSRSNGSKHRAIAKPRKLKLAAQSGNDAEPSADSVMAVTANGGFDSPWLGALPYRWRAPRRE